MFKKRKMLHNRLIKKILTKWILNHNQDILCHRLKFSPDLIQQAIYKNKIIFIII
jgi:hypothetical protein